MAQPIKVRTPIRTGEARQRRKMARLSTRSITRVLKEPWGRQRPQTVRGMQPQTATLTRTRGVAGRTRVPPQMLPTVGEAAAEVGGRSPIAVHRRLVAGAATPTTLGIVAGVHGLRARAAGAAAAAAAAGVAEVSVAERSRMASGLQQPKLLEDQNVRLPWQSRRFCGRAPVRP